MHRVNVPISYQDEFHLPGEVADLSVWPVEDLARFEQEYRADIGKFVIERIEGDAPPQEAVPAPERTEG